MSIQTDVAVRKLKEQMAEVLERLEALEKKPKPGRPAKKKETDGAN